MVRHAFDNYNLISGLHSFMSTTNLKFKNLLPPLSLLSEKDKNQLLLELKKLKFNTETLQAA